MKFIYSSSSHVQHVQETKKSIEAETAERRTRAVERAKKGTPTFETAADVTSALPDWIFVPVREL
jgi:hypothetical protein